MKNILRFADNLIHILYLKINGFCPVADSINLSQFYQKTFDFVFIWSNFAMDRGEWRMREAEDGQFCYFYSAMTWQQMLQSNCVSKKFHHSCTTTNDAG